MSSERASGRLRHRFSALAMLTVLAFGAIVGGCEVAAPGATGVILKMREAQARVEIAELQRRYGQATDLITAQTLEKVGETRAVYRRVFTKEATIGVQGQAAVMGPDAWLAFVETSQSTLVGSQHLIGTQVVDIAELPDERGVGGRATLTSYLSALQMGENGTRTRISGTYTSQVTHAPEVGWQIAQMTLTILAVDVQSTGE